MRKGFCIFVGLACKKIALPYFSFSVSFASTRAHTRISERASARSRTYTVGQAAHTQSKRARFEAILFYSIHPLHTQTQSLVVCGRLFTRCHCCQRMSALAAATPKPASTASLAAVTHAHSQRCRGTAAAVGAVVVGATQLPPSELLQVYFVGILFGSLISLNHLLSVLKLTHHPQIVLSIFDNSSLSYGP